MKVVNYLSTGKAAETQSLSQKEIRTTSDVVDNTDLQLTTTLGTPNSNKETKFYVSDEVKKIYKELNEIGFVM